MPGATATNIRKADIAEDLGRLLLRHFCAIAPISKADDFGIDTIATILKLDQNSSLRELANKTFGIQFKAKSVKEIKFIKPYEYNWLLNLDYPYFIGSVDIINSSMDIYSIHFATMLPSIKENCKGLIITLDENFEAIETNVFKVYAGNPIITLSLADISDSLILEKKVDILNQWIFIDYENIKTRNIGFTKAYQWETNKLPEFAMVNKLCSNEENTKIYSESFDFIDSVLFELKLFNKDKHLQRGIDTINRILKQKKIELFQINNLDFDEFRAKMEK